MVEGERINPELLKNEAKQYFSGEVKVAEDLMEVEL